MVKTNRSFNLKSFVFLSKKKYAGDFKILWTDYIHEL